MWVTFLLVLAIVGIASDTPLGRSLRESVSRFQFPRPTRGQLMLAVLLIAFTVAVVGFLKDDGLGLAARTLPQGVGWLATGDIAAYLDIVAFTALAAFALRLRFIWAVFRDRAWRILGRVRAIGRRLARRASRRRRPGARKPDDDIERWAGRALAAV